MTNTQEAPDSPDITDIATDDYIESLLAHTARSKDVFALVKRYKLTGEDLMVDGVFGVQIYKDVLDTILLVDTAPITDIPTFCRLMNHKANEGNYTEHERDSVAELIGFMFDTTLGPKYYLDTLKDFVQFKRFRKIRHTTGDDPKRFLRETQGLVTDLDADDMFLSLKDVSPFASPIFKTNKQLIGTGFATLDQKIRGIGLGEFGIIVGFSGGGKTALGVNIVTNNALENVKSMYISCEEDVDDISQRFYSRQFEIPYGELHAGNANPALAEAFRNSETESRRLTLANNLSLIGLKGLTPITPTQVYDVMLRKFEKDGFIPELVMLDQMQFITPVRQSKSSGPWELEKQVAVELDELSHRTINGQKFALWVQHQAKGKLKAQFSREEIDGFKGVIHKTDLTLGVGRDGFTANECHIFSLKVRHCPEFCIQLTTDLEYMRFIDVAQPKSNMSNYRPLTRNPMAALPDPEALMTAQTSELPRPPVMPAR